MSAWYDIVRDGPRWRVCRCTNPLDAPGRLATVTVEMYTHRDAAIIRARSLNATAEGLRRLGVAVAVWGAMAAAQEPVRDELDAERAITAAFRFRANLEIALRADAEADLAAERAARRKWELRLRWRAENSYEQRHPDLDDIDRLYRHEACAQRDAQKNTERLGSGITRFRWYFDAAMRLPIAGPRGVLP